MAAKRMINTLGFYFSPTYYHIPSRQIQSFHVDSLRKSEMITAMVSMFNAPHRLMCLNTPGTVRKTWETETFKEVPPGLT